MDDNPFKILNSLALVLTKVAKFSAVAAFSIRKGGQSPPSLDSLNFSTKQGDSLDNVRTNLGVLAEFLNIDAGNIATCNQVHGDTVAVINSVSSSPPKADAIVAAQPGIFPAVKTADCVPILLMDPVHKVCAAVHAGWCGTALRVTRKVVRLMQEDFGTDVSDLVAAIGPAIGPCCYEVDDNVLIPVSRNVPWADRFVTLEMNHESGNPARGKSYRLDLVGVNRFELTSMGVQEANIYSTDLCTSCRPDLFFSHRRDGVPSGRHIAVTGFKE